MLELAKTVFLWVGVAGIAFLIWLLAEGALTLRRTRTVVSDLKERIEPTLAHVEKITSELEPAIARVDPLMERVTLTVDSVNLELMQVDKILSDASNMTGTANNAVQKISAVASMPSNAINAVAGKLRTSLGKKQDEQRAEKAFAQAKARAITGGDAAVELEPAAFELDGDVADFTDDIDALGVPTGASVASAAGAAVQPRPDDDAESAVDAHGAADSGAGEGNRAEIDDMLEESQEAHEE